MGRGEFILHGLKNSRSPTRGSSRHDQADSGPAGMPASNCQKEGSKEKNQDSWSWRDGHLGEKMLDVQVLGPELGFSTTHLKSQVGPCMWGLVGVRQQRQVDPWACCHQSSQSSELRAQ